MKSVRLFIFLCIAILSVTCMSGCNVGTAEVTEYSFSETTDNHEGSDLSREVFAEAEWTGWPDGGRVPYGPAVSGRRAAPQA